MQAIVNMTIDAREFNQAAEALYRMSTRTYPEFVNGQLFGLAVKALNSTLKADKVKIRAELNQPAHETWEIDGSDTLATRIVNARLRAAGKPMIWGRELVRAGRRLTASRSKSAAFIKSGWLPAIKLLAKFVKGLKTRPDREAQIRGKPKGSAAVATPNPRGVVDGAITNTALRDSHSYEVAEKGLRIALAAQAADMRAELQRRIQQDIDRVK